MITLKHISKSYPNKKTTFHALEDVNLTIQAGEIVGILGYSGAGKSTLVRIINGLIEPTEGVVSIDGHDLDLHKQQAIDRMRHTIGMIFQHFNLIHSMTVYDNIKLPLDIAKYSEDKEKRILELLSLVGLSDKKEMYPKSLSGGERQRVGIARALANHPKVLLCDEATSALDQKTATDILDLLKQIHQQTGVTIVFITHQIEVVKALCDRVVVMDGGRIVEDTPIKDLFVHPQSEVSKSLLQTFKYETTESDIYELVYNHKNSNDTILSDCIKQFHIDVNIKYAKTLALKSETIGFLYVQFFGQQTEDAIAYLKAHQVEVNRYA
ncbi:methionine ABC transporter ATP-binding protein [Paracholeplasma manati]|uniref:methionine ABC transporter ATP-binding protein n=1 Tax=Paracholeplasma manati TaxID=591373 RepID=UPI00240891B9|nr:ATP-binding cassette domain-containing protein [Paracholeplasma manati]MDG0889119.1 ATP-binding cassette domain-containing protein [Paracholeplasma manati]